MKGGPGLTLVATLSKNELRARNQWPCRAMTDVGTSAMLQNRRKVRPLIPFPEDANIRIQILKGSLIAALFLYARFYSA